MEDELLIVRDENGLATIHKMAEGTGDSLSEEDIDAGYVDYIYYDTFDQREDETEADFLQRIEDDETDDGGMIVLKELCADKTQKELEEITLKFIYDGKVPEYTTRLY